jgi:hypothetical protein
MSAHIPTGLMSTASVEGAACLGRFPHSKWYRSGTGWRFGFGLFLQLSDYQRASGGN